MFRLPISFAHKSDAYLDCKIDRDKEAIKTAPRITDYLNDDSKAYYEQVKHHLDDLNIPYVEDPNLVRGLDYYTHTAFELMMDNQTMMELSLHYAVAVVIMVYYSY